MLKRCRFKNRTMKYLCIHKIDIKFFISVPYFNISIPLASTSIPFALKESTNSGNCLRLTRFM